MSTEVPAIPAPKGRNFPGEFRPDPQKRRMPVIETRKGGYCRVQVGRLTLHFSKSELIAFEADGRTVVKMAVGNGERRHCNLVDGGTDAAQAARAEPVAFRHLYELHVGQLDPMLLVR